MKLRLILLFFYIAIAGNVIVLAQSKNVKDTLNYARIEFEVSDHNFGDVFQGQKVEFAFKFKNTGTLPLILQNVLSTCGCTVPDWPKEPIQPSEEGIIRVIFDSTARLGRQNKVITIRSNADTGDYRIRISAMVLPPKR
jgi:hypothetical protein